MMTPVATTNRLATIVERQRKTRARDLLFTACVALASIVSLTTISTASHVASSHVAQR